MASFAVSDMCIKYAAQSLPVAQIIFVTGLGGVAIFLVLARHAGTRLCSPAFLHPVVLLRNTAEVFAAVCMVGALALAPLSLVAAITQANPLMVTAGAALFLKEKVGPRRWIAVVVGFAGVLLMLRPNASGISIGAILALGAAAALATRDLSTRRVPPSTTNLQLAVYGFGVITIAGGGLMVIMGGAVWPGAFAWTMLIGAILTLTGAYFAITSAMRVGDVSLVTPFRYSRLIFAMGLGIVVFKERPDLVTLIGAAIVIGSGLYVFLRERKMRQG